MPKNNQFNPTNRASNQNRAKDNVPYQKYLQRKAGKMESDKSDFYQKKAQEFLKLLKGEVNETTIYHFVNQAFANVKELPDEHQTEIRSRGLQSVKSSLMLCIMVYLLGKNIPDSLMPDSSINNILLSAIDNTMAIAAPGIIGGLVAGPRGAIAGIGLGLAQQVNAKTVTPKKSSKKQEEALLIEPKTGEKITTSPEKYSDKECQKMAKGGGLVNHLYSKDCKNLGPGFKDLDPDTLKKLAAVANSYWCGNEIDCAITADPKQVPAKINKNTQVCVDTNSQQSQLMNTVDVTSDIAKEYGLPLNNGRDGYTGMMLKTTTHEAALKHRMKNGKVQIDPSQKYELKSQELKESNPHVAVDDLFTHEVGHTAFGLAHPKDPSTESVMNNEYLTKHPKPSIATADLKFLERCVGKKADNDREL